jgi:hypothetical protein
MRAACKHLVQSWRVALETYSVYGRSNTKASFDNVRMADPPGCSVVRECTRPSQALCHALRCPATTYSRATPVRGAYINCLSSLSRKHHLRISRPGSVSHSDTSKCALPPLLLLLRSLRASQPLLRSSSLSLGLRPSPMLITSLSRRRLPTPVLKLSSC